MGGIRTELQIDGKKCWAIFDSGSRNSYVVESVSRHLVSTPVDTPRRVGLGGKSRTLRTACLLKAKVQGKSIETNAYVIGELGEDEEGRQLEVLIGALAMQQWGIRLILDEERLDLSRYPKEFIEF